MTRAFTRAKGKKLMVMLSYSWRDTLDACQGVPRWDQSFLDHLREQGVLFVDTLQKHIDDFALFRCSPEDYVQRYYIGHYNPRGNHFFAFAVKDEIVEWLDPKPPAYVEGGPSLQAMAATLA
jgi:hypothetical protein